MRVSRCMRRALTGAAMFAAMIGVARSDDLPSVPSPKGFIESSALVPALKDQALMGHPARTRLIGVYLLPDELASIMRGAPESLTIFCRAYVNDEFESVDGAKAFYSRMIANAKQGASKNVDLADPETRRIIQRYIDVTKEREGVSSGITGMTVLGSILETENVYATSMIVAMYAQIEQGQVSIPVAAAGAWIRDGKQILELSVGAQFQGSE